MRKDYQESEDNDKEQTPESSLATFEQFFEDKAHNLQDPAQDASTKEDEGNKCDDAYNSQYFHIQCKLIMFLTNIDTFLEKFKNQRNYFIE